MYELTYYLKGKTMKAWLFQDTRQKQKLGDDKAPWSVGWYDPDGKKKSKRMGAKSRAEKFQRKVEGQLAAGTYEDVSAKQWKEFKKDYSSKVLAGMSSGNRQATLTTIKQFERIVNPQRMRSINTATIDEFVAKRRIESLDENGEVTISPATINKDLRHLRAILRKANRWGYLHKIPDFSFVKEPGKLAIYVTPEHFAELYAACDIAHVPAGAPYDASDWWRALLVTAYMTGWRISSLLSLRRSDVDLETGFAISRAADNKGKRDAKVPLHPVVVEHLRKLPGFSTFIFQWNLSRRAIFAKFGEIQAAAKVKPEGGKARYGFHDLRRAFATMNAGNMTGDALQALMQHKSYTTTQRYINMARQLNPAVQSLFVPAIPKAKVNA